MATALTIGKLAKAAGVNVQTLRYYERRKLLSPVERKPSGYRLYDREALRRLQFIKNAQALGFTLQEVMELLSLRINDRARCGDVQRRAQVKLEQVGTKIRHLKALDRVLRGLVTACRAGQPTDRCPILRGLEQPPEAPRPHTRRTS